MDNFGHMILSCNPCCPPACCYPLPPDPDPCDSSIRRCPPLCPKNPLTRSVPKCCPPGPPQHSGPLPNEACYNCSNPVSCPPTIRSLYK